jgi:flagellar biosynthesis protein FlhF
MLEYFVESAPTHKEAIAKVLNKYGEKAKIMTQRSIRTGGFMGMFTKEAVEVSGFISSEVPRRKPGTLEEEKKKFIELGKVDQTVAIAQILSEVKSLKSQIQEQGSQNSGTVSRTEHDTIVRIEDLLEKNEFTTRYSKYIVQRIKSEFTLDELDDFARVQDYVVDWIAESIQIDDEPGKTKPEAIVLVGPTGVGKTTTIAKLAARYGISPTTGMPKRKVRIITLDNYRIGAIQQLETYAGIMELPLVKVDTGDELKKYILLYHDVDFIFIDTMGESPHDYEKLARLKSLLRDCGSGLRVNLAISATTKFSDMMEIAQQFEPFNYRSILFTKLDETKHIGNLVSLLWEKKKIVSFLTNGQGVPNYIERASVIALLLNLDGFKINRERLEERFRKV